MLMLAPAWRPQEVELPCWSACNSTWIILNWSWHMEISLTSTWTTQELKLKYYIGALQLNTNIQNWSWLMEVSLTSTWTTQELRLKHYIGALQLNTNIQNWNIICLTNESDEDTPLKLLKLKQHIEIHLWTFDGSWPKSWSPEKQELLPTMNGPTWSCELAAQLTIPSL